MYLFVWRYDCICGNVFELADLDEFVYGEFILRNHKNEMRYLFAFTDVVFNEVADFVESHNLYKLIPYSQHADFFHNIYSITCDKASDGSPFEITSKRTCPACGGTKMKSWCQLIPFKEIEVEVPPVSYEDWNSLSAHEKRVALEETFMKEFAKLNLIPVDAANKYSLSEKDR